MAEILLGKAWLSALPLLDIPVFIPSLLSHIDFLVRYRPAYNM